MLFRSLYDLIGEEPETPSRFSVSTLRGTFERPTVTWPKDRFIPSESAWSVWRGLGDVRFSLRREQYLFLNDRQPKIYNSLIDRTETATLSLRDSLNRTNYENFYNYVLKNNWAHWAPPEPFMLEKVFLASQLFSENEISNEVQIRLGVLVKKRPWDKQITGWLARLYIKRKEWESLADLGEGTKNADWLYLAGRQKGRTAAVLKTQSCLALLVDKAPKPETACKDLLTLAFKEWVTAAKDAKAESEEKFFRLFMTAKIEERIAALNYRNGLMWDTVLDQPHEPTAVDMALLIPEFKGYRQSVERRLAKQGVISAGI